MDLADKIGLGFSVGIGMDLLVVRGQNALRIRVGAENDLF